MDQINVTPDQLLHKIGKMTVQIEALTERCERLTEANQALTAEVTASYGTGENDQDES